MISLNTSNMLIYITFRKIMQTNHNHFPRDYYPIVYGKNEDFNSNDFTILVAAQIFSLVLRCEHKNKIEIVISFQNLLKWDFTKQKQLTLIEDIFQNYPKVRQIFMNQIPLQKQQILVSSMGLERQNLAYHHKPFASFFLLEKCELCLIFEDFHPNQYPVKRSFSKAKTNANTLIDRLRNQNRFQKSFPSTFIYQGSGLMFQNRLLLQQVQNFLQFDISDCPLFILQLRIKVLQRCFLAEFFGQKTSQLAYSLQFYFGRSNLEARFEDCLRVKTNTFFDAHTLNQGFKVRFFDLESSLVGEQLLRKYQVSLNDYFYQCSIEESTPTGLCRCLQALKGNLLFWRRLESQDILEQIVQQQLQNKSMYNNQLQYFVDKFTLPSVKSKQQNITKSFLSSVLIFFASGRQSLIRLLFALLFQPRLKIGVISSGYSAFLQPQLQLRCAKSDFVLNEVQIWLIHFKDLFSTHNFNALIFLCFAQAIRFRFFGLSLILPSSKIFSLKSRSWFLGQFGSSKSVLQVSHSQVLTFKFTKSALPTHLYQSAFQQFESSLFPNRALFTISTIYFAKISTQPWITLG